ncbi:MAG: DUF4920 domain-containing protein, partial [Bacteroidota bacterium]
AAEAAAEKAIAEGTSPYPADSVAPDGRSFHGFRIDESDALPVAQLSDFLASGESSEAVKVTGTVDAACKMKGCWMTMKLEDGSDMRVTFKDYGFFVPRDSPGKQAIIEGQASYDTTSVEILRHYAIDGGMSAEEAEKKYTEPEIAIAFEATGVIIK